MRSILDEVDPSSLRLVFRSVFRHLQRGKNLEAMTFIDGYHLLSGDGSGFYSSSKVSSDYCMRKVTRKGDNKYYLQMYAAAFVHPDQKEVVPVEVINRFSWVTDLEITWENTMDIMRARRTR